eukprot:332250-Rhodomonas_salina.1
MSTRTSEFTNGSGLPRVQGNIPVHVLTGMLSSPENRSESLLPKPVQPDAKAYQLTIRDLRLSVPESLI